MTRKTANSKERPLVDFLNEHFFNSTDRSEQAVKLAIVYLNGKLVKRPGITINEDEDKIKVVGGGKIFVGRGGYKLQEAIQVFNINLHNKVCLDIGASTGGFTDCMLQYSAGKIYAIDTGYGQLAWSLRTNEKVKPIERMNVRYLLPERLYTHEEPTHKATFAAIDVSFISALKVIPAVQGLLEGQDKSEMVILIKPQFEAGKDQVGRSGLIRNPVLHFEILKNFLLGAARAGLDIKKLIHSPLLGAAGNLEFLAYATWPKAGPLLNPQLDAWLNKIISIAYSELNLIE